MSLPTRFGVGQPSWYTNPTMPIYEDYASDPTGYEAAVKAWVQSQNGTTPMFQPSQSIAGPNGESGWRMAGNDNTSLNTLTPGEYQAQLLNHRMQQAGMHPGSPNAKMMELAMYSHNQVRPEDYAGAYNAAMTSTGGPLPVLNDAALKFLEDTLGYGPPKALPPGAGVSGSPPPGAGGGKPTTLPGGITAGGKPGAGGQLPPGGIPKNGNPPFNPGLDARPMPQPWPPPGMNVHQLQPGSYPLPDGPMWYMPGANDLVAHSGPMPPGAIPIQQSPSPNPPIDGNSLFPNKNPRPPIYGGY